MSQPGGTAAEEFIEFYGSTAWADWRRLLVHFELGEGFAFLVLLLPGPAGAEICRRQLSRHLAANGRRLAELQCDSPGRVRSLPDRLLELEVTDDLGGIWMGAAVPESDPEIQEWRRAWRHSLAAMNQRRNPIRRRFRCPLVLVGARWLHEILREAAPDLWSVRTGVVLVVPTPIPAARSGERKFVFRQGAVGDAAADPDYALEQAERLRDRPGHEGARAELLLRAGNRFLELARMDAAESSFREAAVILRSIADGTGAAAENEPSEPGTPDRDPRSDLAGSLHLLAVVLGARGQREEALEKAREAVRLYEPLAARRPDEFLPDLARSLDNLAATLGEAGRREEALDRTREALRLYEQLVARSPDEFQPDLARSLDNLATRLSEVGRREEAKERAEQAVRIREELAARSPDEFQADLAVSYSNLAIMDGELGLRDEALERAQQAARLYEQLAARSPDDVQWHIRLYH